ncbi:MAG TPA: HEAT repeat domain-containing protein [Kofleriaceae bacterium]|nr:HEAT repeat domain-containing protein [Kofleriaceae bacterium]
MTPCPTCGKPVDPLRAPAVRVNAGKVVSFCSKECAAAAETKPVKAPVRAPSAAEGARPAKAKTRTPPTGVADSTDSEPVIQIVHEPASGVVTSASDARSGRASSNARAETSGAIQIADTGYIDDYVAYEQPKRSKALVVVLLLLIVIGGAGAAAYYLGFLDQFLHNDSAAAVPPAKPKPEPVAIDAAPPVSPEAALERALAVLREQMKSNSPRVQRVAALALSRTGDKAALEALAASLDKEPSGNARREIAYALARAGDKRGLDSLTSDGTSSDRETRHDAGRRLAQLGNKPAAVRALLGSMQYSQFRLGVAEQLAYVAEDKALAELDKIRADADSSADDKARATIALGHAGRKDVIPALRELLADDRNNAFAAVALAELHDDAARPVLIKQLAIPALRVDAARALRRLAPGADVRELIAPLLAELDGNRDTEQVQIAETLILLAGPPAWSERE